MSGTQDNTQEIWIARDGKKRGPFPAQTLRQWVEQGKLARDALSWHRGLATWTPLFEVIGEVASEPPALPPIPPPPPRAAAAPVTMPVSADDRLVRSSSGGAEAGSLPPPPGLHWFVVFLLSLLTMGLFCWVWGFVQATWVRKVERGNRAVEFLAFGLVSTAVAIVLAAITPTNAQGMAPLAMFLTYVGGVVLYLVACYSMAGSLRVLGRKLGQPLDIGGFTLFFFHVYYLQGQLSWLRRWNSSGQTRPAAPQGTLWLLMLAFPFGLGVLAAISIPAYQDYVTRVQVTEGVALAHSAQDEVAKFYRDHHALPTNNAVAGLADPTAIKGKYVSSLDVEEGRIFIVYGDTAPTVPIRGKSLVLTPVETNGTLSWSCSGTMAPKYLPVSCRG